MRKQNKYITVSSYLKEELDSLNFTKTNRDKALDFLSLLKTKSNNKLGHGNDFYKSELSSVFLRSGFGSHYLEFLKPLVEKGIVERVESYSVKKGKSKKYGIAEKFQINFNSNFNTKLNLNSKLLNKLTPVVAVCYSPSLELTDCESIKASKKVLKNRLEILPYSVKKQGKLLTKDLEYLDKFKSDVNTLKIDFNKLREKLDYKIKDIKIQNFNVDNEIKNDVISIYNNEKGIDEYFKLERAISVAKSLGKSLIQDKDRYEIKTIEDFIEHKKNNVYYSYVDMVLRLEKNNIYAKRNTTNNRLDHNFTSIASEFLGVIKEDNDLVELDMNNSQFAILSHILPNLNTEDYIKFKELSFSGELYDYIKHELKLKTRKEAKNITFSILFSSYKNNYSGVNKIKELFPNVMSWINKFKKENESKDFSVMLQKEESKIFIDGLYKELKKKKIFLITKHDSLIVRASDKELVMEYVEAYFNAIGFEGKLRIS